MKYENIETIIFQQKMKNLHRIIICQSRIKVEDMDELYSMIGERLKHVFPGYRAYVLSYRKESFDAIGLRHSTRYFLYNGALECEMREYEIFSGKRDDRPAKGKTGGRERSPGHEAHFERNSREGYRRSQRTAESGEEKSRDEYRSKRNNDDRERGKSFKSDKPFKSRERSTSRGDDRRESRSGNSGDKPFKSRERSTHERGRGGRTDNSGAKSFKSDKPFSGRKSFDKNAKPRVGRK